MKALLIFLLLCSVLVAEERVVILNDGDTAPVDRLLADGWTIKHASGSLQVDIRQVSRERHVLLVFVMTSPPAEIMAETSARREAERIAAWEKKRAEWKAAQPKVEKP